MDAFWNFSLAVYRQPGVADECLRLQDEFGVDVNLLLFCTFAGAVHGAVLTPADIAAVKQVVRRWHDEVVRPLRNARRALKPLKAGQDAIKTLRAQVKAVELEAERREQAMLTDWATERLADGPRRKLPDAVAANIRALLASYTGAPASPPVRLVAAALAVAR